MCAGLIKSPPSLLPLHFARAEKRTEREAGKMSFFFSPHASPLPKKKAIKGRE